MKPHTKRKPIHTIQAIQNEIELPLWILPDLTWFQQALCAERVIVDDTQNFEKQSPLSRYSIGAPNTIQGLSVPINHSSRGLPLRETQINYQQNWIKDHKQAWQTAYGKTPFYEYYDYRFFEIFDAQHNSLSRLSWELLQLLHQSLQLPNTLILKSQTLETQSTITTRPSIPNPTPTQPNSTQIPIHADNFFTIPYHQVFQHKHGFRFPLSAIDYLFQYYSNF